MPSRPACVAAVNNQQRKHELAARVDASLSRQDVPYLFALTAAGHKITSLELIPIEVGLTASAKNAKKAAPAVAQDYENVLRTFSSPDAIASKAEWESALQTLRPALEDHLRTLATRSWTGRGIPAPPPELREQYIRIAVKQQLAAMNDIRNRFQLASEDKAGKASVDEYIARAEQTSRSIVARAQDRLYAQYEKWAAQNDLITGKIWENSNDAKSRHPQMSGQEVAPTEDFIDPKDGRPIRPRQVGGSQAEFSGSTAIVRYRLKNGKVV